MKKNIFRRLAVILIVFISVALPAGITSSIGKLCILTQYYEILKEAERVMPDSMNNKLLNINKEKQNAFQSHTSKDISNKLTEVLERTAKNELFDLRKTASNPISFYEKEPNNNISQANIVDHNYRGQSYYLYGTITNYYFDLDYFRFDVAIPGTFDLLGIWVGDYFDRGWDDDLAFCLRDANDNYIAWARLGQVGSSIHRHLRAEVEPGTYYIMVMQVSNYKYLYVGEPYGISVEFEPSTQTIPVTSVSLNKSSITLNQGATETLSASVSPTNATNRSVTWSSSNTSVATVSSTGQVAAVNPGTAVITVRTNDSNKTATCTVTVTAPATPVASVSLNKNSISLNVGATETLSATVSPANATNRSVTWSSSNTSVATVNTNGRVTAVAPGTAVITVRTVDGNKTERCTVTVTASVVSVNSVTLNRSIITLSVGATETLSATISPANASNKTISWVSGDPDIASVNQNGMVTGKKAGTATISVITADGGKTATCRVTVTSVTSNALPDNTIIFGNKAFDLSLMMDPANMEEIQAAVDASGGKAYYMLQGVAEQWTDIMTGELVSQEQLIALGAITYKNADGKTTHYPRYDQPPANTADVTVSFGAMTFTTLTITDTNIRNAAKFSINPSTKIEDIGFDIMFIYESPIKVTLYAADGTTVLATAEISLPPYAQGNTEKITITFEVTEEPSPPEGSADADIEFGALNFARFSLNATNIPQAAKFSVSPSTRVETIGGVISFLYESPITVTLYAADGITVLATTEVSLPPYAQGTTEKITITFEMTKDPSPPEGVLPPTDKTANDLNVDITVIVPGVFNVIIPFSEAQQQLGATKTSTLTLSVARNDSLTLEYNANVLGGRGGFLVVAVQGYTKNEIEEGIVTVG